MLRPFGPALSLIYSDISQALLKDKKEAPVDYIAARYPEQSYTNTPNRRVVPLLVGEQRYLVYALDDLPVHKRMFTHYNQTNIVHERNIILDAPNIILHITVANNDTNNDTLVLRTELVA